METCYIFGAAEGLPIGFSKKEGDLVIAADGGFSFLQKSNIQFDILLGDFDSLGYVPEFDGKIIKHPVKKDDTDTMLAVKTGMEMGYKRFVLYGCTGKRLDHTLANLQTLSYIANNGGTGFLMGDGFTAIAIKNQSLGFKATAQGTVSVFSTTERAEQVDIKGMLYELDGAQISYDFPLGVSNEFIGKESEISVGKGIVTVLWSGDLNDLI